MKAKYLGFFLAAHFTMQLYGALGSPGMEAAGPFRYFLDTYGRVTGSGSRFGFFAPRPGAPMRARIYFADGKAWREFCPREVSAGESRERYQAMVGILRNETTSDRATALAQSLAAWAFDNGAADSPVRIHFEALIVPAIGHGEPRWVVVHQFEFSKREV